MSERHTREVWQLCEAATTLAALGPVYRAELLQEAVTAIASPAGAPDDPEARLRSAICAFLRECIADQQRYASKEE